MIALVSTIDYYRVQAQNLRVTDATIQPLDYNCSPSTKKPQKKYTGEATKTCA